MAFETPILYLIFNRPDLTEITFKRIRELKPKCLFIAADGPREDRPEEVEICQQTRKIVMDAIDWDCEVKTLFRDKNLGCGKAVSEAITWFFEIIEMGIIIEDDILIEKSFFQFAEELLSKYKNDLRVYSVGAHNFGLFDNEHHYSYFFTKYVSIWGWATWADRWKSSEETKNRFKEILADDNIKLKFRTIDELNIRKKQFESAYDGNIDTWDYHWSLTCLSQNGLCIVPVKNQSVNVGFNGLATHTKGEEIYEKIPSKNITFPLQHPPFFLQSFTYEDKYTLRLITTKRLKSKSNRISLSVKDWFK